MNKSPKKNILLNKNCIIGTIKIIKKCKNTFGTIIFFLNEIKKNKHTNAAKIENSLWEVTQGT